MTTTRRTRAIAGWALTLACLGLAAWAVSSERAARRARQAGAAMTRALDARWSTATRPTGSLRHRLITASERMADGRFDASVAALEPLTSLAPARRAVAYRFLAEARVLREQFIAVSASARAAEQSGADVAGTRDALSSALAAACRSDESGVGRALEVARAELEAASLGDGAGSGAPDARAVLALAADVDPALRTARVLMTEGLDAAEKLVARAAWHFGRQEFARSASTLRLASSLLGLDAPEAKVTTPAAWFSQAGAAPDAPADGARAQAAVSLCEAMAASEPPGRAVRTIIGKAKGELAAGRHAEAAWWASVALYAMGASEQAAPASQPTGEGAGP